ncbi:MAG TPA: CopG family transcriptional regulator [Thermoproteales archaeon]|nr:CopG family transcriptional regulator [Thermoproteales archaeon]
MPEEKVPIYISKTLYERIKREVEESQGEFKNVEEFIEFVLREVLKEEETEEPAYTPEEEEEIKRRLRSLGYL